MTARVPFPAPFPPPPSGASPSSDPVTRDAVTRYAAPIDGRAELPPVDSNARATPERRPGWGEYRAPGMSDGIGPEPNPQLAAPVSAPVSDPVAGDPWARLCADPFAAAVVVGRLGI